YFVHRLVQSSLHDALPISKERDEYFTRLLADPKTGEIPIDAMLASKRFVNENFIANKGKTKLGLLSAYDWNVRGPYQIGGRVRADRKSTRLNSSHVKISYA